MLVLNPSILPSVHPYHLGFDVQVTALFLKETLHSAANDADMMLEDRRARVQGLSEQDRGTLPWLGIVVFLGWEKCTIKWPSFPLLGIDLLAFDIICPETLLCLLCAGKRNDSRIVCQERSFPAGIYACCVLKMTREYWRYDIH